MKNISILILVLCSFSISLAQERITSIVASTDKNLRYVTEYGGKNYLLEITPGDDVNVYEIIGTKQFKHLWTRNMFYVYKQTNHFIAGNRMVFSPVFGLSSYDFVNNTAPLEYGYSAFSIFGSWINYSSNGALFYDNAAKPFVCDPNTLDISSLSSYYKVQNTSYPYVFTAGSAGNDLQHYYMYNGNTDKTELLIEGAKNEHFGNFDGDYFWFLDKDNAIVRMQLSTANRKEFGLYAAHQTRKRMVIPRGDHVMAIQANKDSTYVEIFDTREKTKIKEIKVAIDGGFAYDRVSWIGDRIFMRTVKNKVYVVDVNQHASTQVYDIYSNYGGRNWPIVDDHLLLPQKNGFKWIDLGAGSAVDLSLPFAMTGTRDVQVVKTTDGYLASCTFADLKLPTLFAITGDNLQSINIESVLSGCEADARMYVVGDQLLLRDEYLYRLEDSELKIEPYKMIKYTQDVINVSGDQLFFKQINENNTYILYTNGLVTDTLCELQGNNLYIQYVHHANGRYLIFMNNTLTEYLPASNSFKTFYSGVSAVKLVDSSLFFLANKLLFEIDDQFKVIPYFLEMGDSFFFFDVFNFRGNVLTFSYGELVSLKNGSYEYVSPYELSTPSYSRIGRYLFYSGFSYIDYRYHFFIVDDQLNVEEVYFEGLTGDVFNAASNQQFGLLKVNNSHTRIFDVERNKIIELPTDKTVARWKYLFDGGTDTIGLIREGNQLTTYRVSQLYTRFEALSSVPFTGADGGLIFYQYDDFVLITGSGTIKVIKNNGVLHELAVTGNQITYSEPVNFNGYIYFMANSPDKGRQVYRFSPASVTHTSDEDRDPITVEIYPNPSADFLQLKTDGKTQISGCQIHNLSGQSFPCISNQNTIDIQELETGLYVLSLQNDQQKVLPIKFVKR
ncbi:MAG: T9SS type A sorting domain-containing protein [Saprospiraceae bacterium]|nr:T9SS type A sorting domain-containing protein [Saprospiraceae bacterium]